MLIRSNKHHKNLKCSPIDKYTKCALYVAILCGIFLGFRAVEPVVFPVVKNFTIVNVYEQGTNGLLISGTLDKVRDCEFISVVGYSGKEFIKVDSLPGSRLVRLQAYGPWLLAPKVDTLELYMKHSCFTGTVLTKLFDGAVVL